MFKSIKKLFGASPKTDYAELVKQGAIIVDVRSPGEYAGGHISGSMNITVNSLPHNLNKLKDKSKVIITCCASGMRSGSAKKFLENTGYTNVYNGGGWKNLQNKIS